MGESHPASFLYIQEGALQHDIEIDVAGPDDTNMVAADDVPELLRAVFRSAGGTHDDWDEYDRVMATERRTAVLVTPERITSN